MFLNLFDKYKSLKIKDLTWRVLDNRYALLEACFIGFLSAIAAVSLKMGIAWVGGHRLEFAEEYGAKLVLPIFGFCLGFIAGLLIEEVSPAAKGGGIPPVKAALAGFPIPLSLKVAFVKTLGTILVLGGGLTLGRRAPTVHIGAALAAQLSNWIPTSPEYRRQMIAAGTAAGVAASFNTPIAGVLFVIEELMRDVSGLTLETAVLASFTGSVVARRLLGQSDLNISSEMIAQYTPTSSEFADIPIYCLLGVLAGILGALFNRSIIFSTEWNNRLNLPLSWRIGLTGLISGLVISYLPPFFQNNAGLRDVLITGGLSWQMITLALIAYSFLTILASGSSAPGGLLAPALVLGSALGYLVGIAKISILGVGSEYTYALAGMGAFFAGVVRVPVTATIIVFEMTTDFNLVLPLMISSAIAYVVGENLFPGSIYQHLLKISGIQLSEDNSINKDDLLSRLTAADVMQRQVEALENNLTLETVIQIMSQSSHRGFPVLEAGKLIGIITQGDLSKYRNLSHQTLLRDFMTPNPITVNPNSSLSDVLYLLNRYQLSRLPVIESYKLVGIITRTDIIKAEAKQLSGIAIQSNPQSFSYLVYQTRSPETGKGRLLLPLSNPENVLGLLKIAGAIAKSYQYEIECVYIIIVAKHLKPSEASVNLLESRKFIYRVERLSRKLQIPIHTQIRLAHDQAQGILDIIKERHINLLLMAWKGHNYHPSTIFGNVIDTLIHKATCELILVKLGNNPSAYPDYLGKESSWIIPVAGGPNIERAIQLLPAFISLYERVDYPHIFISQVHTKSSAHPHDDLLVKIAESLTHDLGLPVTSVPICAHSVDDAIIDLANDKKASIIMLGASQEGLLKQVINGNIPEAIAKKFPNTVIIVRGALDNK